MMTHTHTLMPDVLHKHIFLFHVYRTVSLARMRRYTQLAYLFHQCAMSILSRDSRIADCTVRHQGVERQFSSFIFCDTFGLLPFCETFGRVAPGI